MTKRRKQRPETQAEADEKIPDTTNTRIIRCAIHITSDLAGVHKKCDRRICRTEEGCQAEGILAGGHAHCGQHWSARDTERFVGMLTFGLLVLARRIPPEEDPEDYRYMPELGPFGVHGPLVFVMPG